MAKAYSEQSGIGVRLQFGPSGALETQLRLSNRGDLFVPAAAEPYLGRLAKDDLLREVRTVGTQQLVLATNEGSDAADSIQGLLDRGTPFGICNEQAAAGWRTKQALQAVGLWQRVRRESVAMFPTVTELAGAVRDSGRLQAGIIWDTTAKQFGLKSASVVELESVIAEVSVAVLSCSREAGPANDFAEFLLRDRAQELFGRRGYGLPRKSL